MKHLFVTVINQKSALAIWGMMRCFASCIDIVIDGNKARTKTVLHFYTVFQVYDLFFCSFQYFVIMSMHFGIKCGELNVQFNGP